MSTNKYFNFAVFIIPCLLFFTESIAQTRYLDPVFDRLTETRGVRFSTGVPQPKRGGGAYELLAGGQRVNVREHDTENVNLNMDIFEPAGDEATLRPVVIFCFGGGFFAGSRNSPEIVELARQLALRGYVTASIDYRLGLNVYDEGASRRAPYRAIQDSRAAVRFFRADADNENRYRIDPNKVYIAGYSAGGIAALNNVYLDKDTERPEATRSVDYRYRSILVFRTIRMPDLGCLDCAGDNQGYSGKANGAIAMAGAVNNLADIEGPDDAPVLMFHSSNDNVVPFREGQPLAILSYLPNFSVPSTFGSASVNDRAGQVGAPKQYFEYPDRGHLVHFRPIGGLYPEIVPRTSEFLFDLVTNTTNQVRVAQLNNEVVLEGIQAYPNPVRDGILHIKANFVERGTTQVQLFDATGRVVYQQAHQGLMESGNVLTVDMSTLDLPLSGVYMLKVTTRAGAYHQKIAYTSVN